MGTRDQRARWLPPGAALLLLVALLSRSGLLMVFALLGAVTAGLAWFWGRYALERVEYRRYFALERCFVGEEIELTVETTNRKALPVTYLQVDDTIPDELEISARRLRHLRIGRSALRFLFGLAWYQKVIRHYRVTPKRRGHYRLGPALLRAGDPFGYIERERVEEQTVTLTVYPRPVPLDRLGFPTRRPFGDIRSGERIFEDPMRVAGVREYSPGDPLNRIHWKASAATGQLQVRLLEPSSQMGLAVFLNARSYEQAWMGTDVTSFEAGCTLAASIVNWACAEALPAGLFANGLVQDWGMNLRLPPARGPQVLVQALEGLARLEMVSNTPVTELLADEVPRLAYGTGVVVISSTVTDALCSVLMDVARTGRPVSLVVTSSSIGDLPRLSGLRVYHVPGGEPLDAAALA